MDYSKLTKISDDFAGYAGRSERMVRQALEGADKSVPHVIRIWCQDVFDDGHEDIEMEWVPEQNDWCMWDQDEEVWWPLGEWSFDRYDKVELVDDEYSVEA